MRFLFKLVSDKEYWCLVITKSCYNNICKGEKCCGQERVISGRLFNCIDKIILSNIIYYTSYIDNFSIERKLKHVCKPEEIIKPYLQGGAKVCG